MSVTTTLGLAVYLQRADAVTSTDAAVSSSVTPTPTPTAATVAVVATQAATQVATQPAVESAALPTVQPGIDESASVPTLPATVIIPAPVIAPVVTAAASTVPPAPAATGSGLVDGTYAGDTFTNRWGPVQVQLTISGGVVTDVSALQTPTKDRKSVRINDLAVPRLNSEVTAAQSAQIDIVSGATYTSNGYRQSIQSALDAARAACVTVADPCSQP